MKSIKNISNNFFKTGLTLIEVLIALAIFSSLIIVVLPITDLFKLNSASTRSLSATTQAQQWVEIIQRDWSAQNNFDNNCVDVSSIPSNVRVQSAVLNLDGSSNGFTDVSVGCGGSNSTTPNPELRRLRVQATDPQSNRLQASFTLDIRRPTP